MDQPIINVGDELVVRIAGYPVATAHVFKIDDDGVHVGTTGPFDYFVLPPSFVPVDEVDGVDHTRKAADG